MPAKKRSSRRPSTARSSQKRDRSRHLTQMTTDHDVIRRWIEERGGQPSAVKRTSRSGEVGIVRIDFPGYSGEGSLEPISWDDFFKKFDDSRLELVYQERTASGQRSNFNKLVKRETVERKRRAKSSAKKAA